MALAQLVVQVPGTLIKSGDWNNEFQNILTHPIALISPTTGAINFNLQAHTGLLPNVISATSASAGQALIDTGGATVWGTPTIQSSQITIAGGSTGQVFSVTSSNSAPVFQVIAPDGGLSTTLPSTGMLYYISTGGVLIGLPAGTSGQVVTLTSNLTPSWATPSASGSGSGTALSSQATVTEDFIMILSSAQSNLNAAGVSQPAFIWYTPSSGAATFTQTSSDPSGVVSMSNVGTMLAFAQSTTPGAVNTFTLNHDMTFATVFALGSTTAGRLRLGFVGSTNTNPLLLGSTSALCNDALFFDMSSTAGTPATVRAVSRSNGNEFAVTTTATCSSSGIYVTGKLVITSSGTTCSVITNGVTAGSFTSSQLPTNLGSTVQMAVGFGTSGPIGLIDAWQLVIDRKTLI